MNYKNWLAIFLFSLCSIARAQEIRVTNSFIILINNELPQSVAGMKFVLSKQGEKDDIILGGYYPGVLYTENVESKNLLYSDSTKRLHIVFKNYKYKNDREVGGYYDIDIKRCWFKESLIILKIHDINTTKDKYTYSFEIPGYTFGVPAKNNIRSQ